MMKEINKDTFLHILIVEDEPTIALLEQKAVEGAGHSVEIAENGTSALAALEGGGFDMVLLDHQLPDMSGREILAEIMGMSPVAPVVIMITAHGDERLAVEVMKAGARDYLVKDFESSYLKALPEIIARNYEHHLLEMKKFQMLTEVSPVGIFQTDSVGDCVYVNQKWSEITGLGMPEALGKGWANALHPDDRQRVFDEWYGSTKEIRPFKLEYRFKHPDGAIKWVYGQAEEVAFKGKLLGRVGTITDITERRQADESIRILSRAIEQAGESILIADREGIIEYVNPAFSKLTGYSAGEVMGQTPAILKSGNQDDAFYVSMWGTITRGKVWHGKIINKKKDGSFYPAMLTISPIIDESGDMTSYTHFVAIYADLTRLEDMEKQFHQAQKMEALGILVGGIAHDFNNMLAGMTGNLYLAKSRTRAMPDVVEKLANVESIAFRAAEMIQQLLTFARKARVSMKPIPLTPFIKETLKLLRTLVPENIAVHQDICNESLQINADAAQLHQVLMNLVDNARDAVEGVENPCITIGLAACHADGAFIEARPYFKIGDYAHLSVEDNGAGIPEDQIDHLFEPFFTTKEQGKGTGLGLAMIFGAIKTHRGFVEVESKEGEGSTFHIYIPLLKPENITPTSPRKQQEACGHGELILLVDDQQQVVETGKEVLESLGYQVLTAHDGGQAVELFEARAGDIDLVILDVVMPAMGGNRAAQCMRRINPHVKIIFSTGYDKDILTGMEKETVLCKPFSIVEMSYLIRRQLSG